MEKAMNEREVVKSVAKRTGMSLRASHDALKAVIDTVTDSLAKGQDVRLPSFGKFRVSDRKARKGRNPQTGKPLTIAARKVPAFRAGAPLKKAVNK